MKRLGDPGLIARPSRSQQESEPSRFIIGAVELVIPHGSMGDPATLQLATHAPLGQPMKCPPMDAAKILRQLGTLFEHRAPDVAGRLLVEAQRPHPRTAEASRARRVSVLARAWARLDTEKNSQPEPGRTNR
jgi:hypothetical protein